METFNDAEADSRTLESKTRTRTPAYSTFDLTTDKLEHLLTIVQRGSKHFVDELKNSIDPEITALCTNLTNLGSAQLPDDTKREQINRDESEITLKRHEIEEKIKSVSLGLFMSMRKEYWLSMNGCQLYLSQL